MPNPPARKDQGFTLVELMVVILILGMLAAALVISIPAVFGKNREDTARNHIILVQSGVESFKRDFGSAPPNALTDLPRLFRSRVMMVDNGMNASSEALLLCLRTRVNNGPYIEEEKLNEEGRLVNTDADKAVGNVTKMEGSATPMELADPWGNPYIYVNTQRIKGKSFAFQLGEEAGGSQFSVLGDELLKVLKDSPTGVVPPFVIWSVGENGKNEYGGGDDIASWQ